MPDVDVEELKSRIADACGKVMSLYGPGMEHQVTGITNKCELGGKPFEVLGLDVLIDSKLKPWVLEINDNPSLSIYFDSNPGMGGPRHTDADINQTDLYVNSRVVGDAINLARKSRAKLAETDSFRTLTKVHPIEDAESPVYSNLLALRSLFYTLCPIKNKNALTMQGIEKLLTRPVISSKMTRFDI